MNAIRGMRSCILVSLALLLVDNIQTTVIPPASAENSISPSSALVITTLKEKSPASTTETTTVPAKSESMVSKTGSTEMHEKTASSSVTTMGTEEHTTSLSNKVTTGMTTIVMTSTPTESSTVSTSETIMTSELTTSTEQSTLEEEDFITCTEDAMPLKDAVMLKLKSASNCKTIKNLLAEATDIKSRLCQSEKTEDCSMTIYVKSKDVIISPNAEGDIKAMTALFQENEVKETMKIENAALRWGKRPPNVLIPLIMAGLLLAVLLIAGYCFKNRRQWSPKGERLVFHPDDPDQMEEGQVSTLASTAQLTPQEKPEVKSNLPESDKSQPPAASNGHSAKQAPVADTEL
ncbi:hematopoietic progenitor cell antigen CD34-like isoform X2 [Polypterus senegalus]|uniref:hematopoietic progenitor cell antigen CD34-like isoform X2 n=1 Tax=Polypterus senegalus TaxID=55291 RepID=UPI001966C415|nr:hematopoietic progenitor cell antigen CD34-like isoform X2 [Polypterus senegalus]